MQTTKIALEVASRGGRALAPLAERPYKQQIFITKNYVVYQIRCTRLCDAQRQNETKKTRKKNNFEIHVMVDWSLAGWLAGCCCRRCRRRRRFIFVLF